MIDVNSIEMSKNGIYGKVHGEYFSLFDFTQKKLMEGISMPSLITYFKNEKQFIRTDFENYYMIKPKIFLIYFKYVLKIIFMSNILFLISLYICIIIFKTIIKKQQKKQKTIFFITKCVFLIFCFE